MDPPMPWQIPFYCKLWIIQFIHIRYCIFSIHRALAIEAMGLKVSKHVPIFFLTCVALRFLVELL